MACFSAEQKDEGSSVSSYFIPKREGASCLSSKQKLEPDDMPILTERFVTYSYFLEMHKEKNCISGTLGPFAIFPFPFPYPTSVIERIPSGIEVAKHFRPEKVSFSNDMKRYRQRCRTVTDRTKPTFDRGNMGGYIVKQHILRCSLKIRSIESMNKKETVRVSITQGLIIGTVDYCRWEVYFAERFEEDHYIYHRNIVRLYLLDGVLSDDQKKQQLEILDRFIGKSAFFIIDKQTRIATNSMSHPGEIDASVFCTEDDTDPVAMVLNNDADVISVPDFTTTVVKLEE